MNPFEDTCKCFASQLFNMMNRLCPSQCQSTKNIQFDSNEDHMVHFHHLDGSMTVASQPNNKECQLHFQIRRQSRTI